MVGLWRYWRVALAAVAVLALAVSAALAEEETSAVLFDRPVLSFDPGMHTAPIRRADMDAAGQFVVTGSEDRTVRVWSAEDGKLLRTIRVPRGPGNVGKIFAVAISPDGNLIAAGGWTRWSEDDPQEHIYLFDRESGTITARIEGVQATVNHLTFSRDGNHLAGGLWGTDGVRVYGRETGWAEVWRDTNYGGHSYGVAFARDGRLATTSYDGKLRLYGADGRRISQRETGHKQPFGLAFNPADGRLAVGFDDTTDVLLFDGTTLEPLPAPDTSGIDYSNLFRVAWSADGATLFAGGLYTDNGNFPVIAWSDGGAGPRRVLEAGTDTVMGLLPMGDGDLIVAAQDPWLGRLGPDGVLRWAQLPKKMDPRAQRHNLSVSKDGMIVDFGYEVWGKRRVRFDLASLSLTAAPPEDGLTSPPVQKGLDIISWMNSTVPLLNGKPIPIDRYETSRSLVIHPDEKRFVLGSDWSLRAFDTEGNELWQRVVPSVAWAVNITGDARLVVAAYGDGTIRWHRMEDGAELLAFFPFNDGTTRWLAWTPEGYFASAPGTAETLGWHVNRGWDKAADFYPITHFKGFYQPEAIKLVLPSGETPRALGLAKQAADRKHVQQVVDSPAPPGPQLHVLTIGVSDYANHDHLTLDFADDDARDLATKLLAQEGSLYAKVTLQALVDKTATRQGILDALSKLNESMQEGHNDVAVIHFSGHGVDIGGEYFLLPHDVDASSESRIDGTALHASRFRRMLKRLGKKGKVLVLLDACHSGAVIEGRKGALPPNIEDVRKVLADAGNGVIVITSSTGQEESRENPDWKNGAFTEAVLEALDGRADDDRDDWLTVSELEDFIVERVRGLTGSKQNPRITVIGEHHFQAKLFRKVF